jgi:hypothetical protein
MGHRPRSRRVVNCRLGFIDERRGRPSARPIRRRHSSEARQTAAANFLLARLAAAFLGAAFMPTLRPRPSDFAKPDRCAGAASRRFP